MLRGFFVAGKWIIVMLRVTFALLNIVIASAEEFDPIGRCTRIEKRT